MGQDVYSDGSFTHSISVLLVLHSKIQMKAAVLFYYAASDKTPVQRLLSPLAVPVILLAHSLPIRVSRHET